MQTTPEKITKRILQWTSKFSTGRLGYIPVQGVGPGSYCFLNCGKLVSEHGGEIIQGWLIWEDRYLLEAEHHSVYKDLNGNIYDPTRPPDGETKILFLEDPTLNVLLNGLELERYSNLIYPSVCKKTVTVVWTNRPFQGTITHKVEGDRAKLKQIYKCIEGLE